MSKGKSSSFLCKCTAVVLVLMLFLSVIAACSSPTTGTSATPAKPAATGAASAPKAAQPEGALRVGVSTIGREQFDPYEDGGSGPRVQRLLFDSLVGTTPDATDVGLVGGLATKWEQSTDGSGWTFYLRKGVQWDKGYGEVTAEDVKYSLDRIIFREGGFVSDRPLYAAGIKQFVVVDPYTLRIDTKTPFPELPFMLSSMMNAIGNIVPKKAIEQMGEKEWKLNPVASGPYRLAKHEPGQYVKYEARADYWGGVPRYKEVFLYGVPEDATRVAMLKRGELDIAEVMISNLKELQTAGLQLVEKKDSFQLKGFIHNQWEGALAKKEVRLALNLAVNKQELADKLFEGRARPMGGDTPSYLMGGKNIPVLPYDPEQAKKLLAQAGYANGLDLNLLARTQAPLPLVTETLAGYFRAVGIRATVRSLDDTKAVAEWRAGTLKDTVQPFNSSNRPFFVTGWNSTYGKTGPTTVIRDADPEQESLLQAAAKSKTLEELATNQSKFQQYLYDNARELFLLHTGSWLAASSKVSTSGWNGGGKTNFDFGWRQVTAR